MLIKEGKKFRTLETPIFVGDKCIKAIYCGNKLVYPELPDIDNYKYELVVRVNARMNDYIQYVGDTFDSWMITYPTKDLQVNDYSADFTLHLRTPYPIAFLRADAVKCRIHDVPSLSGEFWQEYETASPSGVVDLYKIYTPRHVDVTNKIATDDTAVRKMLNGFRSQLAIVEGDWRQVSTHKQYAWDMREDYGFNTPAFFAGWQSHVSGTMGGSYGFLDEYSIEIIEDGRNIYQSVTEDTRWREIYRNESRSSRIDGKVENPDMTSTALPSSGNSSTSYGSTGREFFKNDSHTYYPPFEPGKNVPGFSSLSQYRTWISTYNEATIGNIFQNYFPNGSVYASTSRPLDDPWVASSTLSFSSFVQIIKNSNPDFSSLDEYVEYLSRGHLDDEV